MITVRKASDRGSFDHGWLKTSHTFSFGDYRDPAHVHFRTLRVINEDIVEGGQGFATHGHRDMEIVTYVISGALEHRDSMGNSAVIRAGMFQRMSAGRGVEHSEFNHSKSDPVHLYQIWIFPEEKGIDPGYEELSTSERSFAHGLLLVASRDGQDGSMVIHQDASIWLARLVRKGEGAELASRVRISVASHRHVWIQVTQGSVALRIASETREIELGAGDGAAISGESEVHLLASDQCGAEALVFDLA